MDDQTAREIAELGRQNAETIRRHAKVPHPWDEWDVRMLGGICPHCGLSQEHAKDCPDLEPQP
jgi:hypothetical protein